MRDIIERGMVKAHRPHQFKRLHIGRNHLSWIRYDGLVSDLESIGMGSGGEMISIRALQALELSPAELVSIRGDMSHNGDPREVAFLRTVAQAILRKTTKRGEAHLQLGDTDGNYDDQLSIDQENRVNSPVAEIPK